MAGYRLLGVLGGGGMGRVYLGLSRTGRRLAIKMLSQQYTDDAEYRERFAREVAAARLVSPLYTAAMVDADPHAKTPWLATTFIEGPSLDQWVEEHGPLSPDKVMALAAGLAEALGSIHNVGLVHRDLKPSNVIVNPNGPHIIDFGIALSGGDVRITTSLMVGTPAYMAPERVNGLDAGPSGDIYSLGATLYYAATGGQLIGRGSFYDQIIQVAKGGHDLSRAPEECRPIIDLCLQQAPQDRPTPEELLQVLVGLGVTTPETGWWPELEMYSSPITLTGKRSLTRRALLVGASAFGVAAIGGGVVLSLRQRPLSPSDTAGLGPEASALTSPTAPAVTSRRLAWQVAVDAEERSGAPGAMAEHVMIDRGQRLIWSSGSTITAKDSADRPVWDRQLAATAVRLWAWGDTVLAGDARRLWLIDALKGDQQFVEDLAEEEEKEHSRDNPDRIVVQIQRVMIAGDLAVVSLGTAIVALDRACNIVWRAPRQVSGGRRTPLPVTVAANTTHLVTRSESRVALRRMSDGRVLWQQPVTATATAPAGPPREGNDEAWLRQEGRFVGDAIVMRDGPLVEARSLGDGKVLWQNVSPNPIACLEVSGNLVLTGAARLVARHVATGEAAWDSPLRGARVVGSGDFVLAAHDGGLSKLDAGGREVWQEPFPSTIRDAGPDRLTADAENAYLVLRRRPGGARGAGPAPAAQGEPRPINVVAFRLG